MRDALRPWPRMMRAETAAAYCDVDIEQLPPGFEIRPGEIRWVRDQFDEAWENADTSIVTRRVYFIRAELSKLVKIGVANNMHRRLRELQMASPEKLEIIASIEGDQGIELAFHRVLAAHRAHGEWFRIGPWLDAVLEGISAGENAGVIFERQTRRDLIVWAASKTSKTMHLKSTEAYTFLTANKDKRKGPFLIHRDGVAIGFGYSTQRDAESAVRRSVDQHARWVSPRDYSTCKHDSVDYQTFLCSACKKDLSGELF